MEEPSAKTALGLTATVEPVTTAFGPTEKALVVAVVNVPELAVISFAPAAVVSKFAKLTVPEVALKVVEPASVPVPVAIVRLTEAAD